MVMVLRYEGLAVWKCELVAESMWIHMDVRFKFLSGLFESATLLAALADL